MKKNKSLYNIIKSKRNCQTYNNKEVSGICNVDADNYYYAGSISDNYLKINGTDTLFRIVKTETKFDNNGYYVKLTPENRISANPSGATENNNFWWYENSSLQYLYDTSHYNYAHFDVSFNIDGTINVTVDPTIHNGGCSSNMYTYSGWNDSEAKNYVGCTGSIYNWQNKVIKNPYFELIYNPLNNWFLSLDEEIKDIAVEYKFCIKENDCDNYYINSKFATLSVNVYKNLLKVIEEDDGDITNAYIWDKEISPDDFDINEIVFSSLADGINRIYSGGKWWRYSYNNTHLSPTIIIDGDLTVLSGTGTKNDPYILKV